MAVFMSPSLGPPFYDAERVVRRHRDDEYARPTAEIAFAMAPAAGVSGVSARVKTPTVNEGISSITGICSNRSPPKESLSIERGTVAATLHAAHKTMKELLTEVPG